MSQLPSSTLQLRRSQRWLIGAAVLSLAAAACSDTTSDPTFQLNLDRPVDMAFACYGGLRITGADGAQATDEVIVSAQPLASCDFRTQPQVPADAVPKGQESLPDGPSLEPVNYYGLILQSAPGTVSFARFPAVPASAFSGGDVSIRDADPLTPGKNGITVGIRPVAIATDSSGCFAVTANAGSRDLSMLDLNSALAFDGKARVSRLEVRIPGATPTRLDASPSALVAVAELDASASAVDPNAFGDRIGVRCPAAATGLFYVAFPDCHLVAAVEVVPGDGIAVPAFAEVVAGVRFGSGLPTILEGKEVTCSGGASDPRPTTIAVQRTLRVLPGSPTATVALDTQSMVIGAENSNLLTKITLASSGNPFFFLAQLPLEGAVGVLDVALSPQLGLGNRPDAPDPLIPVDAFGDTDAVGGQYQFVYAVTSDGTVRVADMLTSQECDTQIDPRLLTTKTVRELGCLPIAPMMRRSGARGPGIELPIEGVASAVNIIRVSARASDDPPVVPSARLGSPNTLVGTFGVITSTTGVTYMVDIDDDDKRDLENPASPLTIDLATTLPHQLRDLISRRSALPETTNTTTSLVEIDCTSNGPVDGTGLTGGTRMNGALSRPPVPEVVAESKAFMLPTMRNVGCVPGVRPAIPAPAPVPVPELSFAAFGALDPSSMGLSAIAERKAVFPDTRAVRSEDWRLIWEGALSVDGPNQNIDGPSVRQGTVAVSSSSLTLTDRSRPFCAAGVEAYDIVQLRGCDPQLTGQCGLGRACYAHPDSTTGIGACLPEKNPESLAGTCRDFLLSARRYTVQPSTQTGSLSSGQLTLAPRKRVLRTSPVGGCTNDNDCAAHVAFERAQTEPPGPIRSARCEVDPGRKGDSIRRCVMTCNKDSDCDSSSTCDEVTGTCMEGVLPDQRCVAGVQRYDLRASEAFTVLGSTSGYLHNIIADNQGQCVKKANPDPLQVGRIPLQAPPCTGVPPFETPNPCSRSSIEHYDTSEQPASCPRAVPAMVPAIFFRNPGLRFHFVDPTYTGDAQCRNGTESSTQVVGAPMTFSGLAYALRIAGGFTPLTLRTSAVVPVRVVRGPQQSIWVVDEGDYLSESQTLPSTLGKVFRIESASLSTVTVLQ